MVRGLGRAVGGRFPAADERQDFMRQLLRVYLPNLQEREDGHGAG